MNTLKAEKRSLDVKAKRLRREGYVVGNVFGREMKESIPVKMVKRDVEKLLKTDHKGSQIMLDVDGTAYDVLIKNSRTKWRNVYRRFYDNQCLFLFCIGMY